MRSIDWSVGFSRVLGGRDIEYHGTRYHDSPNSGRQHDCQRLIEPELYDVIKVLGGKNQDEIIQVSFPASFPAIFAGLQISLSNAWTCVPAAELVASHSGLGFIIVQGMKMSDTSLVIGGMVIIAIVAWSTSLMVIGLERLLCPWKRKIEGL